MNSNIKPSNIKQKNSEVVILPNSTEQTHVPIDVILYCVYVIYVCVYGCMFVRVCVLEYVFIFYL